MFQPEKNSLKNDIALVLAVAAAGFKLTDSKSIDTDDGACWHATLVHGRTKIITVSDGGHGGGTESRYHATTPDAKVADKGSLEKLFAIPEVTAVVRSDLMYSLDLKKEFDREPKMTDADYAAAKADIESRFPVPTDESIESLIDKLAQATKFVEKIKRAMKTKLVFVFEGDDAKGAYVSCAIPDTPANRARLRKEQKRNIDYFMADQFGPTNEPKGA